MPYLFPILFAVFVGIVLIGVGFAFYHPSEQQEIDDIESDLQR